MRVCGDCGSERVQELLMAWWNVNGDRDMAEGEIRPPPSALPERFYCRD